MNFNLNNYTPRSVVIPPHNNDTKVFYLAEDSVKGTRKSESEHEIEGKEERMKQVTLSSGDKHYGSIKTPMRKGNKGASKQLIVTILKTRVYLKGG